MGPEKSARESTHTEEMIAEMTMLIKAIEAKLDFVLSAETARPEALTNIQNPLQNELVGVIERLESLKDRINL